MSVAFECNSIKSDRNWCKFPLRTRWCRNCWTSEIPWNFPVPVTTRCAPWTDGTRIPSSSCRADLPASGCTESGRLATEADLPATSWAQSVQQPSAPGSRWSFGSETAGWVAGSGTIARHRTGNKDWPVHRSSLKCRQPNNLSRRGDFGHRPRWYLIQFKWILNLPPYKKKGGVERIWFI